MKIAVVIASHMRPVALAATLSSLSGQSRPPDEIVVSIVGPDDLPDTMPAGVKAICSDRGASRQSNRGTQALSTNTGIVVFLDDDMILHRDHLRGVASVTERWDLPNDEPCILGVQGHGAALSCPIQLHPQKPLSNLAYNNGTRTRPAPRAIYRELHRAPPYVDGSSGP